MTGVEKRSGACRCLDGAAAHRDEITGGGAGEEWTVWFDRGRFEIGAGSQIHKRKLEGGGTSGQMLVEERGVFKPGEH